MDWVHQVIIVCGEGGDKDGEACKEMVDMFVETVRECSGVRQEDVEEYGVFPSAIAQEYNKLDCDTMPCVKMESLQWRSPDSERTQC